ncbi:uncharacterized protein LOC118756574, partial [Rhagoletis pomonella]|uniref:uncharacterized protein LOC118756574 n=1 Tax=Rhagoletis pomonella TaxID=28610 RepID=UPI00178480C0
MTFGISCAPCIAHYIRDKNAESYRQQYPQAYEAIRKAHYVDDYIDSTDSEQEALDVATLVRKVYQAGGFEIRNWTSNSTEVLMQLLDADFAAQAPVQFGGTEKVLEWRRLYRAVATFLLYFDRLNAKRLNRTKPNNITPELIKKAINLLFKQAQAEAYSAEISLLRAKLSLSKQSRLAGLNVYLDENGIMRTQGRADSINCRKDAIVMPRESYISFLIVKAYHVENHHMAHETTINNVMASYYVPRLRVLYKSVRKSCQKCKINNVVPEPPQMAPIPAARLASFARPFTYTGVDYFGPILVNVGRHKEKRWGVLFTCLTLRAVHFEIAYSLDTSSCIMCLRNFMARRGTPMEIYSDNGTNFRATEKAVREELMKIDFDKLTIKYDRIKWRFNPPGAPHMGGAWERLVRTTKTILKGICPMYSFNDESLRSALMEAEYIINSRPLTF